MFDILRWGLPLFEFIFRFCILCEFVLHVYYSLIHLATSSASNITASINSIPMLNGTNFKTWHENLQIVLSVMDLDLVLRVYSPAPLTVESSYDEKRDIERWEKSNRMCLMIIKKAIPEAFRGTISEMIKTTKEFLEEIKNRFAKNEKFETSTLLANLISMR